VEAVEDRHAAIEQLVIVRRGLGERADARSMPVDSFA